MKLNRLLGGLGKVPFPKKDRYYGQDVEFERNHRSSEAFTLIEMMIVVSILALIIGMTTQMANHVVASNNLTLAGESMQDALRTARHLAMAKDRVVEVRFYKTADPESLEAKSHINAMQTFVFDAENLSAKPFKQIIKFPSGVVLSDNETLSSLVTESRIKKNWQERDPKVAVPGSGGAYVAYTLRFMPDGSTDLDTQKLWFATLHASHETKLPPDNYVTVQVKATRGGIRTLRPN